MSEEIDREWEADKDYEKWKDTAPARITQIQGELVVDHEKGIIYFHLTDLNEARKNRGIQLLEIMGLPSPIPPIGNGHSLMLNASTLMRGAYGGKK